MGFMEIAFAIVTLIVGLVLGAYFGVKKLKAQQAKEIDEAKYSAQSIIETAKRDADAQSKEIIINAKEQAQHYRNDVEDDLKERRSEVKAQETR